MTAAVRWLRRPTPTPIWLLVLMTASFAIAVAYAVLVPRTITTTSTITVNRGKTPTANDVLVVPVACPKGSLAKTSCSITVLRSSVTEIPATIGEQP